jgi:hypothetical protein
VRKGDPYVTVRDALAPQTCEFFPEGTREERTWPGWALYINDESRLVTSGSSVPAVYEVMVTAVFIDGEAVVANLQISADPTFPRSRLVASGWAPGALSYRLVGIAQSLSEAGESDPAATTEAEFWLQAARSGSGSSYRAIGVSDLS